MRGEGGILRNAQGERFMERNDPEGMVLSTRDRVTLANDTESAERGGVWVRPEDHGTGVDRAPRHRRVR